MSIVQVVVKHSGTVLGRFGYMNQYTECGNFTSYCVAMWNNRIGLSNQTNSYIACDVSIRPLEQLIFVQTEDSASTDKLSMDDPELLNKLQMLVCGRVAASILIRVKSNHLADTTKIRASLDYFLKQAF